MSVCGSIVLVTAEIATSPAARVSIGRIEVDTLIQRRPTTDFTTDLPSETSVAIT